MIELDVTSVINIISRTPATVRELVANLEEEWLHANEGPDTWTPHEVVAHLIYCEQTNWIPRMRIILDDTSDKKFPPFDRAGHFSLAAGRSIDSLLHQFEQLRLENILILVAADITEDDLRKEGIHPALGPVTLRNLLATWVAHDMTHISQITRVIAKQYEIEVGPWKEYLRVLKS
jgi:hypothetical protein